MAIVINSQPSSWGIAGNSIIYRVGGNQFLSSGVPRADYRIYCKLIRTDIISGVLQTPVVVGVFIGVPVVSQTFVASSVTYYYVDFDMSSAILNDLGGPNWFNTTGRNTHTTQITYKCDFYEFYNGAAGTIVTSNLITGIAAGRPELRNYDSASFIAQYLTAGTGQKILNLCKPFKALFNQIFQVNFYNTYTSGFVNIVAKAYYRNGADFLSSPNFVLVSGSNPGVGFLTWNINLSSFSWATTIGDPFYTGLTEPFEASGIYKLELWVGNPTTAVSEVFTVDVFHPEIEPYAKVFVFRNSLGFIETLVTTGQRSSNQSLISETADMKVNNLQAATTKVVSGNLLAFNKRLSDEITQNTGWMKKSQFNFYRDFIRSEFQYELVNGYLYPIVITGEDLGGQSDSDLNFARVFTFKYAQEEVWVE